MFSREKFLIYFGPGLLGGITLGDWLKLIRENRFAIAPTCLFRAAAISFQSILNTVFRWYENRRYCRDVQDVEVEPPLFVLGHWRNGTSHLHNLLAVDDRFAYPNNYQACFPHTFLSTEATHTLVLALFFPRRRPMDNVEWHLGSPQEDEFALCISSLRSPCMGWVFRRQQERYDKYLTLREVPDEDIARWQAALLLFLKKLTWKFQRPLILKSPPHTCRIKLLLQIFPDAKFVHIHRNPFTVFQSSKHTFRVNFEWHRLQRPRLDDLDGWILRQYKEMYEVFFEERQLIPNGHFHEVCFEELEKDPLQQVEKIYATLNLPDFGYVRGRLKSYVDSLKSYQKNIYPEPPAHLRKRISQEWRRPLEEWGYDT